MNCPSCGKENQGNVKFCRYCGGALGATQTPPPQQQTPSQQQTQPQQFQQQPPPMQQQAPLQQQPPQQPQLITATTQRSPVLMAVLNFIFWGVGSVVTGQTVKGIALTIAAFTIGMVLAVTVVGILVVLIVSGVMAYDAHKLTEKLNSGQAIEPWEFFWQSK